MPIRQITAPRQFPTLNIAVRELKQAWKGLPGYACTEERQTAIFRRLPHTAGKWKTSPSLLPAKRACLCCLSPDPSAGNAELGKPSETDQEITENPAYDLRILNHWDNLDRSIERGYAGKSLWNWEELPGTLSDRYEAYARANASIGINATVLNNVNASSKSFPLNIWKR